MNVIPIVDEPIECFNTQLIQSAVDEAVRNNTYGLDDKEAMDVLLQYVAKLEQSYMERMDK
jgi:hypothetical protein